jgi:hypothetical protein
MKRDNPITPTQVKALQAIFSRKGFSTEDRHEFIANYTGNRTSSTKELTVSEAAQLFEALGGVSSKEKQERQEKARKLVGAIYKLSLRIDFLNKDYDTGDPDDFEMNKAKLNKFCRERTKARKNITQMTLEELAATKQQLESILRKQK